MKNPKTKPDTEEKLRKLDLPKLKESTILFEMLLNMYHQGYFKDKQMNKIRKTLTGKNLGGLLLIQLLYVLPYQNLLVPFILEEDLSEGLK